MMATKMMRLGAISSLLAASLVSLGCAPAVPAPPSASPSTAAPAPAPGPTDGGAPGTAKLVGGVQRISIDLSTGSYVPSVVVAKAGVPFEITFGQGQGCLSSVLVPDFGVDQDLSAGPAVVELPAMKAGEYEFSCGMQMVFGKIVVR